MSSYEGFTNVPLSGDSLLLNSGRSISWNKAIPIHSGDENEYCVKNQQDATLAVLFISHCKITLHVSDASRVHRQEY